MEPPAESDSELAAPPGDDTFAFEQLDGVSLDSLDFAFAAINLDIPAGGGGDVGAGG